MTFIVVSYDLDELISLCDRIAVFFPRGNHGNSRTRSVSRELLSRWMAGLDADKYP